MKVTARVVGIIKKFSKTYGGSILSPKQMLDQTKVKLKKYAQANSVSDEDINKYYRVFVPYNN
jgi:hypothetical protein